MAQSSLNLSVGRPSDARVGAGWRGYGAAAGRTDELEGRRVLLGEVLVDDGQVLEDHFYDRLRPRGVLGVGPQDRVVEAGRAEQGGHLLVDDPIDLLDVEVRLTLVVHDKSHNAQRN